MSNRRSARNRHRPAPMPMPQLRKTMVAPEDFQVLVQLGAQVIPKVHVQALWTTAQETRSGVPAGIIASLAGAGAVVRAVGAAVARHAAPPPAGVDPRQALPAWAVDVLQNVGLIEPPAPTHLEDCAAKVTGAICDCQEGTPSYRDRGARPVKDELDLVERAAAANLVIAS